MRRVGAIFLAMITMLGGFSHANAVSIDILSQTYSVRAGLQAGLVSYSTSSPFDLQLTIFSDNIFETVHAEVSGTVAPSHIFLAVEATRHGTFDGGADATATLEFRPSSFRSINVSAVAGSIPTAFSGIGLTDVTDGTVLLSLPSDEFCVTSSFPITHTCPRESLRFLADPSHIYRLDLSAQAIPLDSAFAKVRLSVPEPESSLLLAIGLAGLGFAIVMRKNGR